MITVEWIDKDGNRQRREFVKPDGNGQLIRQLRRQGITNIRRSWTSTSRQQFTAPRDAYKPDPRVWSSFRRSEP